MGNPSESTNDILKNINTKKQQTHPLLYNKKEGLPFKVVPPSLPAESEGFEPPDQLPGHRISSAARSTTPATFLAKGELIV